jgi:WD40 repeat protein
MLTKNLPKELGVHVPILVFVIPVQVVILLFSCLALSVHPGEVESNISKLGSKSFDERETAAKVLDKMGPKALEALRQAKDAHPDLEVRKRASQLVQAIELREMDAHSFRGHDLEVYMVGFSPDGRYIFTSGYDRQGYDFGTLRIWEGGNNKEVRQFKGKGITYRFALSPDGKRVATGAQDGDLCLWDTTSGNLLRRFPTNKLHVMALAYSPDGHWLLSGSNDGKFKDKLQLWDVDSGEEKATFHGSGAPTYAITWLQDGGSALTGGKDRIIRLWNLKEKKEVFRLEGHTDTVTGLAVSPDGQLALSSSWDGTVRLWNLKTGRELRRLLGHSDFVLAVKFTPDGRRALSASHDGTVKIWDVNTGKEIRHFDGNGGKFSDVAISPDGKRVVGGSMDGKVWTWRLLD